MDYVNFVRFAVDIIRDIVSTPFRRALAVPFVAASLHTIFFLPNGIFHVLDVLLVCVRVLCTSVEPDFGFEIVFVLLYLLPFEGILVHLLAVLCGTNRNWLGFTMMCLRCSMHTIVLPLYFTLAHQEEEHAVLPATCIRIVLPQGAGSITVSGRLAKVLTTSRVMRTLAALVCFFSLVGGLATAAVLVSRLQLLWMDTVFLWLTVSSFCSLVLYAPRFLISSLRLSPLRSIVLLLVAIPAAIATVHALDAFDVIEEDESIRWMEYANVVIWNGLIFWKCLNDGDFEEVDE